MTRIIQPEWCVADASVLLELNQTATLNALFSTGVRLLTSPLTLTDVDDECRIRIEESAAAGLIVIESAPDADMVWRMSEKDVVARFTVADRLLCRMAGNKRLPLLTGCGCLSRFAEQQRIRVRSFIWVLDRLVNQGNMLPAMAINKLLLLQNISPWVNNAMCLAKINTWKKMVKPIKILSNHKSPKLHSA